MNFRENTMAILNYKDYEKMPVVSFGYWEDICYKNGPLIVPSVFEELIGPWYKKITNLVHQYGIEIVSVDCDGLIDSLIPTWIENGVNTMFPIEVGTWNASIAPWRQQYGTQIRGVGGYIPCPDHRIAPDAKFELVQYYCHKMQKLK